MPSRIKIDYNNIYHSSPDMCLSVETRTGQILECNDTLLNILGSTQEEILVSSLYDLYAPSEREKVIDNLESIKANRQPKNKEFILKKKNGELLYVTLKLNFVKDINGNIIYTNAVWRDIRELKEAQYQIELEKEKVQEKNENLTQALQYAKLIQSGTLPSQKEIANHLPNSFIIYRPKDIVSGDFYCFHTDKNKVLFSVFDSTGHGIPSALLSMLGSSLVHQIVNEMNYFQSDVILNKMRSGILKYLKQDGKVIATDGMDGALCIYDTSNSQLQFSGANNSILIIRKNNDPLEIQLDSKSTISPTMSDGSHHLYQIKGNKQPIGYFNSVTTPFSKTVLQIKTGDQVYLFSDGFQDQFGGMDEKKYLTKNFKKLLLNNSVKEMEEQANTISSELDQWQGKYDQTDDICIWGVQF
jgi:PAS domain S-box-containing protein